MKYLATIAGAFLSFIFGASLLVGISEISNNTFFSDLAPRLLADFSYGTVLLWAVYAMDTHATKDRYRLTVDQGIVRSREYTISQAFWLGTLAFAWLPFVVAHYFVGVRNRASLF